MDDDEPRFSFIGRRLDARFAIGFMRIPAGAERLLRGVDWAGALVVVEHGILELVAPGGTQTRFVTGAILSMAGLPLCTLRNPGRDALLLSTAKRRGSEAWASNGLTSLREAMSVPRQGCPSAARSARGRLRRWRP